MNRRRGPVLARIYSISRGTVNIAFSGLQKRDLLTIFRDAIPTSANQMRRPNQYRLKPLLSSEERAARWQKLEEKHSPLLIAQARALATQVDYGNDFGSADELAAAITTYGYQAVSNITAQVAAKSATNPKRRARTITTSLRATRRTR